ncbi:MAG: hypothetical protein ABR929_05790 [Roseiarcus sp.]
MAKKSEFSGPLIVAVLAGVCAGMFVLFADKLLLIDTFTKDWPFPLRLVLFVLMAMTVGFGLRYYVVLGGAEERRGSKERERYDGLRARLAAGGTPALVYNRVLEYALDRVDRLFRDAGRADQSWFIRLTGWDAKGARWTAEAYDTCLLLALVYPIAAVLVVWAIFGHVGVAERALNLPAEVPVWRRWVALLPVIVTSYLFWRSVRTEGMAAKLCWYAVVVIVAVTALVLGAFRLAYGGAITSSVAVAATFDVAGAGADAGSIAVACTIAGAVAYAIAFRGAVAVAIIVAFIGATVLLPSSALAVIWAKSKKRLGVLLAIYSVVFILAIAATPCVLSETPEWKHVGSLLLFYGLFTLINAPFDWLALGCTRALLRRGLARGVWWPFAYALFDVVAAALLVAGLAFAMTLAAQTFDDFSALRGHDQARILPLSDLFASLETAPTAYENWWVWIVLFSSMIPSFLNLALAFFSFLRGLPWINAWILRRMAGGKAMRDGDRLAVVSALTGQVVGGTALAIGAFYAVVLWALALVGSCFARILLWFSTVLEAADVPAGLMALFGGG